MLQIQTVMGRAEQGVTAPFICTTTDGQEYFVKGLHANRASQINEWISGNMAAALNLPIAPFALLEVGEDLYEELPKDLREIGQGICFGSLSQKGYALLEQADVPHIGLDLRRKIAAFDWFIRNEDRTRGNPNLLYRACNNPLIVIDHNCAFDHTFNPTNFIQNHIFTEAFKPIFSDWVLQTEMEEWLITSLPAYQYACNNLPSDWKWANPEQDQPANYDYSFTADTIQRINNGQLWSRP